MGLFDFFKKKKARPVSSQVLNNALMGAVNKLGSTSAGKYWENFKLRKPADATAIEDICGRDLSKVSDKDAFQIVSSIQRWSVNSRTPIPQLKSNFLSQMEQILNETGGTWDDIIDKFRSEKSKEAASFNISPDNTLSNIMLEMAAKRQQELQQESWGRQLAKNLNIADDEIDAFLQRTAEKASELNLAPDISKLDREENKLFALAQEGVNMLDGLSTFSGGEFRTVSMKDNGRAEALILCSTMVIDLHSHFQNELDMDLQTDRYFLLLADEVMGNINGYDVIKFINSRIEFYKTAQSDMAELSPLAALLMDNAYGYIYNALYLNPECDDPKSFDKASISPNELIMFRKMLEDTQKAMQRGRNRILGNESVSEEMIRNQAIDLFKKLLPASTKSKLNQDVVHIMSDVIFGMVKHGGPDAESKAKLPSQAIAIINKLTTLFEQSGLSDQEKDDMIEDITREVAKSFPK